MSHPFLHWGGGDRDGIVTTGGTQTPDMSGTMSNTRAVPNQNDQCHTTLQETDSPSIQPNHVEITNEDANCTKCINVYFKIFECWNANYKIQK